MIPGLNIKEMCLSVSQCDECGKQCNEGGVLIPTQRKLLIALCSIECTKSFLAKEREESNDMQ